MKQESKVFHQYPDTVGAQLRDFLQDNPSIIIHHFSSSTNVVGPNVRLTVVIIYTT